MKATAHIIRRRGRGRPELLLKLAPLLPGRRNEICTALGTIAKRITPDAKRVALPLGPRYLELVAQVAPELEPDAAVREWYLDIVAWEGKRIELKGHDEPFTDLLEFGHAGWRRLWPFQRKGVNFLLAARRVMLCDKPGLGKTAQAIVALSINTYNQRVLVICPRRMKQFWVEEVDKWWDATPVPIITVCSTSTRKLDWQVYKRTGGIFIVHWELVRLMPELQGGGWQWVVCDEAHRAKNRKTQTARALKKIPTPRLVLMTGTPFANSADELWQLLNLVRPDVYTSYWRFYEMYVRYIQDPYMGFRRIVGVNHPDLLTRELAPYMLRRTKEEVLPDMPRKVYTTLPVELTKRQKELYADLVRDALAELDDGETLTVPNAIALRTRLRQIVSTTATLEGTDESGKLDAIVEFVQDVAPEKVVIFTLFRPTVERLVSRLSKVQVPTVFMMGGREIDVDAVVKKFQENEGIQVLVSTLATGGEGLTLTAASTLIFVEKHDNPARQEQAEDRIHRIGQTRSCQIISTHCRGTVDDVVQKLLDRKEGDILSVLTHELTEHILAYGH
jgi:SNF2 family DNA or RNA helicase